LSPFCQTIRLHPASKIFTMSFSAKVTKNSITKANKRKPDPPIYTVYNLHEITLQETISLFQNNFQSLQAPFFSAHQESKR
jgi:hypothetical protein